MSDRYDPPTLEVEVRLWLAELAARLEQRDAILAGLRARDDAYRSLGYLPR